MSGVAEPAGIVEFNYLPVGSKDPYRLYRKMRETGRLLRTRFGALIVHRYDDVRRTHLDHESFSMGALSERMGPDGSMRGGAMMGGGAGLDPMGADEPIEADEFMMAQTMLMSDPPDHERLRQVVNRAFTPRAISALEPRLRQLARDLLAPLDNGGPVEIVADFAGPLPTIVISELLGVPSQDAPQFREWSEALTGTNMRRAVDVATSRRYGKDLRRYLAAQVALRKKDPTDDLIGRMVEANRSETITDAEVVAACVLLLLAGNETTMRLITNMVLALGRFPDQRRRLVECPELIPSGVEETLRYDTPVQMLFRAVKNDSNLAGHGLAKGELLLTMLAAANRDPDVFTDADAYIHTRIR